MIEGTEELPLSRAHELVQLAASRPLLKDLPLTLSNKTGSGNWKKRLPSSIRS